MTDKKKTAPSKADAIRKAAASLKAKGEKPRPTVIQKMLAKDGITVAPAQVSMTLKAAGYSPLRKGDQQPNPPMPQSPSTKCSKPSNWSSDSVAWSGC